MSNTYDRDVIQGNPEPVEEPEVEAAEVKKTTTTKKAEPKAE